MKSGSIVVAVARADFLERVRRYSFLFTLGFSLYLGYIATTGNLVLRLGNVRGVFNSAWVGALLSLVASTFISLAGFYFVKNTIERDRQTRVGQILAATPISKFIFVLGKMFSNLAVLSLMVGVLALSGMAMQLISGEDRHIEIWKLVAPFLLLALPGMAVVAAIAVLFETVPWLRGGFGNVIYFFAWTAGLSVPLMAGRHATDLMGISIIADSARNAAHLTAQNGPVSFSLTLGMVERPLSSFRWAGLDWTSEIILSRLMWLGFALVIVGVAAWLFDRFDPSGGKPLRASEESPAAPVVEQGGEGLRVTAGTLTPLVLEQSRSRFVSVLEAELRLMVKGQRWWWYLTAAALAFTSGSVPSATARGIFLACAWMWPLLLWSSMGVREMRDQTYQLIFSAPHPISRQLPAVWCAGFVVALLTGCGFGLRSLVTGNLRGFVAWLIGAVFIPTLALALGVWSGTGKPFEIIYTLLWYVGPMHAISQLDFMGSAPTTAPTNYPSIYGCLSAVLILAALAGRKRQLRS